MKKVIPTDAVIVPDQAERVFTGQIFDVYQWPQELFDGTKATFEMLKRPDTVQTICVVDDQIIVLEEEQPHSGKKFSFGGGRVDPEDGSTLHAAQREVHEETGHSFKKWRLVQVSQPHTKVEWFVYIYLAWDVITVEAPHIDAGEKIKLTKLSFEQVKKLSQQGVKYIDETQSLFEDLKSMGDLMNLPDFAGQEVDR